MGADPGVGVLAALSAGLVSFLSPCVLPLVPGYLSAVSGASVSELDRTDWRRILVPSLIFIASFSAIFVLLGLAATGVGSALRENQDTLTNRPHNGREQERDPTWRSGRAGILPFG